MSRTIAAFVLCCLPLACSSPADDGNGAPTKVNGQCQKLVGVYTQHMVERSGGTCGAVPDSLVELGGTATGGSDCTGGLTFSADHCSASGTSTCAGGTVTIVSDCAYVAGGLNCKMSFNDGRCVSIYDVTYRK